MVVVAVFRTHDEMNYLGLCCLLILQEGDFEMIHIDKVESRTFNVAIAPFSLSTLGDDIDPF